MNPWRWPLTLLHVAALTSACVERVELARSAPDELLVIGTVSDHVVERFASEPGGERDDGSLKLLYPAEGTELPENLGTMRFAWQLDAKAAPAKPGPGAMMMAKGEPPTDEAAYFELCLDAGQRSLCLYTDATHADIDAAHWSELVAARQTDNIAVRLRGLLSKEDRVLSATERGLVVSGSAVHGALYYLEQATSVIRRVALSSTSADGTTLPTQAPTTHFAISRDGKRMAFSPTPDVVQLLSLPTLEILWSVSAPVSGAEEASMAFDPTARRIAFARAGSLALLDTDDGALLPSLSAPDSVRISHLDWSPDSRYLAGTSWPSDAMPDTGALEGTSLVRLPVALDGTLGAPELLVAAGKRDDTLAFPVHSRDGTWLAYLQFKGKLRDGKEGKLWVVKATGESATLLSASVMKPKEEELMLVPSSPSWLPSEDPTLEWLSFSAQGAWTMKTTQLWLTPVHKRELALAIAAPSPAVWLPWQSEVSANLEPVFAQD